MSCTRTTDMVPTWMRPQLHIGTTGSETELRLGDTVSRASAPGLVIKDQVVSPETYIQAALPKLSRLILVLFCVHIEVINLKESKERSMGGRVVREERKGGKDVIIL